MTTAMTEKELQAAVIDLAHIYRWRVAHFRPAMNERGQWRTAVAADGKGFPDLVMVSTLRVAFVELKSEKGRLSAEQTLWLEALSPMTLPVDVFIWRPADWQYGTIERYLKENR